MKERMGESKNEGREIKAGRMEEVQILDREFGKNKWNLKVVQVVKKEKEVDNLNIGSGVSLGPLTSRC